MNLKSLELTFLGKSHPWIQTSVTLPFVRLWRGRLVPGPWADDDRADQLQQQTRLVCLPSAWPGNDFAVSWQIPLSVLREHSSLFNLPQKHLSLFGTSPLFRQLLCWSCHVEFSQLFTVFTAVISSLFQEKANRGRMIGYYVHPYLSSSGSIQGHISARAPQT